MQSCHVALNWFVFVCRTGKVELEIPFPCKQVTSAAFGGKNLDILYVTTAAQARSEPQTKEAGHLFAVTGLGAKGVDGVKVRVWSITSASQRNSIVDSWSLLRFDFLN